MNVMIFSNFSRNDKSLNFNSFSLISSILTFNEWFASYSSNNSASSLFSK